MFCFVLLRNIFRIFLSVLPFPQIPNHTIMQYFRAHGIRHAIARQGGCECTAEWLGVEVIPGKWSEALHAEEIRQLISNGKLGGDVIGGLTKKT